MQIAVQVDIDQTWSPALCHHLACAPQRWQEGRTKGAHLEFVVDGVPAWVVEATDDEPWYARRRRSEFRYLLRDLIAGAAPGYDRHAPLDLRDTEKEWKLLASERTHSLRTLIASVDGAALGKSAEVTEEVKATLAEYDYEPGGRYTREKCWRHDHVSGGHGKGSCVSVMPDGSGVFCYGEHSEAERADGYAYITAASLAAKLSGQLSSAEDEPMQAARLWAAQTPSFDEAVEGLRSMVDPTVHVVQLVAALRLGAMLRDPAPRPAPLMSPNTAQIVWDADQRGAAQILPGATYSLDDSIDPATRVSDCAAQYPAFLYFDPETGEWCNNKAAVTGFLRGDASRLARAGIRVVRVAPVPSAFEDDWYPLNGVPARRLLPPGKTPDDPAEYLNRLLDTLPVPDGIEGEDAEALRLCWLVPALTESCPGALPLILFTGGSGAGKGVTIAAIGHAWRHHVHGSMAVDGANEIDNKLVAGRAGGIWTLDELSESGGAALPRRVMNHLKAVMTHDYHDARIFFTQKIVPLRMSHAWFSTGRTMSGLDSKHQTDWRRRSIIVQFPAQPCAPDYNQSLDRAVDGFEPVVTARALVRLLADSTVEDRMRWSHRWPGAMPGWQWLTGLIADKLNRGPDPAKFVDRLPMDRSAVDAFTDWWMSGDANAYRVADKQHSFRPVLQWLSASGQRYDGAGSLASQLIEQTNNTKRFDVPETADSAAGVITIYDSGQYRWRYKPKGQGE